MSCAYCNSTDNVATCCIAHPNTGICKWCRATPGRPEWHRSPHEGRACCGTKRDSNPNCSVCGHLTGSSSVTVKP